MRIAITGATGRIGAQLTRRLLAAGHEVRALSRGGPALDELVKLGAEPFLGSFDTGAGELEKFFQDVNAAFLMVKSDWNNIHGHYPVVAQRLFDALSQSPVELAVSLSAFGADVDGATGHSACFHTLERKLNELSRIDLVHLRAAWFMENMAAWTESIARYGRMAWFYEPELEMPWVATDDIADLAAKEFTHPTGDHRAVREAGSEAFTMSELAAIIGGEIGRPVEYRYIDRERKDIEIEFLKRFGTSDRWLDDNQSAAALNNGFVRFHGDGPPLRPQLPTKMQTFIKAVWKPTYSNLVASGQYGPETFYTWSAR